MLEFISYLLVGIVLGLIVGASMPSRGFGIWGDLAMGLIGAFIGGYLFLVLGITISYAYSVLASIIGSVVFLAIALSFKHSDSGRTMMQH